MQYKNMEILGKLWDKTGEKNLICPQCGGSLTMVQLEPLMDMDSAYTPYRTVIECNSCEFKIETNSYTILGSIKDFDAESAEIGSWTPTGSRDLSTFKHHLDFNLLRDLKKSGELVEFLISNNQVIQVIG